METCLGYALKFMLKLDALSRNIYVFPCPLVVFKNYIKNFKKASQIRLIVNSVK